MTGRRRNAAFAPTRLAAAVFLLTGIWGGTASAGMSFVPKIGAMGIWTDNLDLAGPGERKVSGEIWQLTPGFDFDFDSPLEHARITYEMHALEFSPGGHEIFHRGDLFSETRVLPDWFFLDLAGDRTQSVTAPAAPVGFDGLYPIENLANVSTASVRPILRHKFRLVDFEASYTRGFTREDGVGAENITLPTSNERDADATLSSVDPNGLLTWSAGYQRTQVDYDSLDSQSPPRLIIPRRRLDPLAADPVASPTSYLPYLYERVSVELGVRVASSIRLLARGGKESDPFTGVSTGGLGSTYWAGGFDWTPDRLNELRFLAGRRFYGTSYEALWRRQTRMLNLQVSYTEQPTTQQSLFQTAPLGAPPVVSVPGTPQFARLTNDVFLQKLLSAAATLTGRLTEIGLSVTQEQRTYVQTPGLDSLGAPLGYEDKERSATLYATRRLGPLTDLRVSATFEKMDLGDGGGLQRATDQRYSLRLSRRLGVHTAIRLGVDHIKQTGAVEPYEADLVTLGIDMTFDRAAATRSQDDTRLSIY